MNDGSTYGAQTERQTVRQTKRERGLQLCIDTKMNRLIKRQTEPQRDRFAPSQNDRQTDRQKERCENKEGPTI